MRRLVTVGLVAAAVGLAACGGDDDKTSGVGTPQQEGDRKGAENAVRGYLRALTAKNGGKACSYFTPDYQRSVVEKNREFARRHGADNCAELISAITAEAGPPTFEGQKLNGSTVDKLKLVATVRVGGEEQNATVTGSQGLQRYELVTSKGRWLIASLVPAVSFGTPTKVKVRSVRDYSPQSAMGGTMDGGTSTRGRISGTYAVPFAVLGTLLVGLAGWGVARYYRDRRIAASVRGLDARARASQ